MPNMRRQKPADGIPARQNRPIYRPREGTPTEKPVSPYWYMPKRKNNTQAEALRAAFEGAQRPLERRSARQRRPFNKYRGY